MFTDDRGMGIYKSSIMVKGNKELKKIWELK